MKNYERKIILAAITSIVILTSGCGVKEVQTSNEVSQVGTRITEKGEVGSTTSYSENEVFWKIVFQDNLKYDFLKSGFISEKVGIATGFTGENYFTNDGGKNWTISKNESNNTNGFDILQDNIVWYGDDFGDVGVSEDMGKIWKLGKGAFIVRVSCISAIDSTTAA